MKISLILPCYNVGKYIEQCLDTVFAQNLPEKEYEVICVNDFSTDNTATIIRQYQEKHENLILLEHTENKNLGASRNTGFNISKGKFIWFIDPDDYITENCLSEIIEELENNNLEILEFNTKTTDPERGQSVEVVNYQTDSEIQTGIDYLYSLMNFRWGRKLEVWRRVYKKEFLINNSLYFSESLFGIEDLVLFYQSMIACKRFKHITSHYYVYRTDNSDSITNSRKSLGIKYAVKVIACIEVIRILTEDKNIDNEEFKLKAIETYHWSIRKCYKKIYTLDRKNVQLYINKIKPHKQLIMQYGTLSEYFLTTNTLLVKSINTIFAPFIKIRYYLKGI